jgi:hypothetical protein
MEVYGSSQESTYNKITVESCAERVVLPILKYIIPAAVCGESRTEGKELNPFKILLISPIGEYYGWYTHL